MPHRNLYLGEATPVRVAMVCPACGQSGPAVLDELGAKSGAYSPETLTFLSSQFYFRMPKSLVGPMEVVCSKCGAILD
jgi:hypothetical protein